MFKPIILTFIIITFSLKIYAQKAVFNEINNIKNKEKSKDFSPFSIATPLVEVSSNFKEGNSSIQFIADFQSLNQIEKEKPTFLQLSIPINANKTISLELIPMNIFGVGYKVINANNETKSGVRGVYYKGIVANDNNSIVSISIIDGELSGIVATNDGNFVVGKLKDAKNYIYYNANELLGKPNFVCDFNDDGLKQMISNEVQSTAALANVACRAVGIYFEADNAIYKAQGSNMTTATNFVNSLFSQIAALYSNEGIEIQISQLKIWDTADPYVSATSTSAMLSAFSTQVGSTFTGDLAHLISGRSLGGGVAYLDVLCNKGKGISANISSNVVNIPTYSWNVEVVTHEMGHNFGSPHTHSCSWPGGAIDNCGPTAGYTEGSCTLPAAPTNGGTIMSYCHLVGGIGINFNNGFGLLPGNLIRSRTQSCMGSAVAPTNINTLQAYNTSVILTWEATLNAGFTVEYKPTTSSTWTVLSTSVKSITINGLTANTTYDWRIKTGCSPYVTSTFSTNATPAISYCAINYTTGCNTYSIGLNDVIIDGVNFNASSGCTSSGGYDFIYSPTKSLEIGKTYSISLSVLWNGNPTYATIWIDYNKNGTFEASEKVFVTTTAPSGAITTITGSFTVPVGTSVQTATRMRVVSTVSSAPTNPCGTYTYGETEEFLVNIINSCASSLVLNNPTDNFSVGTNIKQASATSGSISATNFITGGTNTYQAKTIMLNAGFKVDLGAVFKAEIGGCN